MTVRLSRFGVVLVVLLAVAIPVATQSQQPAGRVFTTADYDQATGQLGASLTGLVVGGTANATWLPDERFWYLSDRLDGAQILLVDPATGTRVPAFDHARVATALSAVAGQSFTAETIATTALELSRAADAVIVTVGTTRWSCDVRGAACGAAPPAVAGAGAGPSAGRGAGRAGRGGRGGRGGQAGGRGGGRGAASSGPPVTLSPDGTTGVFIRDWNLWVRETATGAERQLTKDGVEHFGYATDNAGWTKSDRAVVLWSPNSKKIATQQQDERHVGDFHMLSTNVGNPTLQTWKYPLPGDKDVQMVHRVIIDVDSGRMTRLQMDPDVHRATLGDDLSMNDYEWNADASKLALVSTSRFHKDATFRIADATTGVVKTLFTESERTHYESRVNWQVLWDSNELIWYSQRDNWGHLYLYDLTTGQVKNQITKGDGPITGISRLDEKTRTMWVSGLGREAGQDPYLSHFYKVKLDGTGYVSLTPDDGTHSMDLSPSGRWIVDTYSRWDLPPVVTLRDGATGTQVMELERADISKLTATGWKAPMPFHTKAADGETDIYGMLFRPATFDATRTYPIINQIYPGPQSGSIGSRAWNVAHGDRQALAELGFVVVSIDGRGTPNRSKSFHDAYYGAMGRDNTIPDQMAAMKELASRYPWIDIDRTGIWGHSGGGFATTSAMFRYPDFWKVGISESGNHDQRNYEDDWGERYQGELTGPPGSRDDSYSAEANQEFAKQLKGKLLIAHGGMDSNVPVSNTMLVVEALIRANKDFELLIFPNAGHGYGQDGNYMMRRRWDFFVKHLLGGTPPANYAIVPTPPGGRSGGPQSPR
ncbi:MAG: DPP IV N-terminal domain-containing protein [Acidobacteria bacterium]|nr:DPP IV N-terminal domain-containing protein [Acidobacteriota bacterium]